MSKTAKSMVAEANEVVPKLSPTDAEKRLKDPSVLIVDVRDPSEVAKAGKIKGAINVSRGMLEFKADPESPYYDQAFQKEKTVLVYCASGGRSALSGKALKELGYRSVYNVGGFKELQEAGAEIEPG